MASVVDSLDCIHKKFDEANVSFNPKYALQLPLKNGNLYSVFHPLYESWFRGRVISFDNDLDQPTATIKFIDYGDTHTIFQSEMRGLPEALEYLMPLATQVTLRTAVFNSSDWPASTTEKLKQICDSHVRCKASWTPIGDIPTDGPDMVIQMLKTEEGENVIDELMRSASLCEDQDNSVSSSSNVQLTSTPAHLSTVSSPNSQGAQLLFVDPGSVSSNQQEAAELSEDQKLI